MTRRVKGLSDRSLAWLFIAPTMLVLLAINIFPLIWTIRLSFTSFRANRPDAPLRWLGLDQFNDILTDPDVWEAMQVTARFVVTTVAIETASFAAMGFGRRLF
jgi:multiple sugar transport system permease protein